MFLHSQKLKRLTLKDPHQVLCAFTEEVLEHLEKQDYAQPQFITPVPDIVKAPSAFASP